MIYIIIYLIGCIAAYFMGRKAIGWPTSYTLKDRWFAMMMSLFSWANFLAALIAFLMQSDIANKKAKW